MAATPPQKLVDPQFYFAPKKPPTFLTDEQVRDVYVKVWSERTPMRQLAAELGVGDKTIRKIKHKRSHKRLTDAVDVELGWA